MESLKLNNLKKSFGNTEIIKGVNLSISNNEIHAIIGPNGAGKSTLFNLISHRFEVTDGQIIMNGTDVTLKNAQEISRMGLSRSFQITNIFPKMSVFENVRLSLLWAMDYKYSFWHMVGKQPELNENAEIYYRLKNHEEFCTKLEIKYSTILPRMSRDFLINFSKKDHLIDAKKKLGKPPLHLSQSKSLTNLHKGKSVSPKKRSRSASPLKRIKEEEKLTDKAPFDQLGTGYFAVLIDQGEGTKPYQGLSPLNGKSLSDSAETYFAQSEQLPTSFHLKFGKIRQANGKENWRAGGIMVQHLPTSNFQASDGNSSDPSGLLSSQDLLNGDNAENWHRINYHLGTIEELEMIGPSVTPSELLVRLFHEEGPRIFDTQSVRFGCSCSEERVRQSLSIYSAKDISKMITEEGLVTADCQFCGAHYELDPKSVGFEAVNSGN